MGRFFGRVLWVVWVLVGWLRGFWEMSRPSRFVFCFGSFIILIII